MEVCDCRIAERDEEEIEAKKCKDCGWPLSQSELEIIATRVAKMDDK